MIQAGTIRIGSGRTLAVAGAYWISSISRLRKTTLPGVTATSRPTTKFSVPTGFLPLMARSQSSKKFCEPGDQIKAAGADRVRARISGLVSGKFDGADHVKELPRRELDHVLVMLRDSAQAGGRVVPPLLLQQESLVDEVEGPLVPIFAGEAPVLRQRLDARLGVAALDRVAAGIVANRIALRTALSTSCKRLPGA